MTKPALFASPAALTAGAPVRGLFGLALAEFGPARVAQAIGLHPNTVRRWIAAGGAPASYHGDFARLLGLKPPPGGIDKFYTKPEVARRCWDAFNAACAELGVDTGGHHFIDPAAGSGRFYELMPAGRRTGMDIAPAIEADCGLLQADFLTWKPAKLGRYAVVSNPPFGLRGHLALLFVNHAAAFADLVGFILPQLFASDGKGVPAKRVRGLALARSEELPAASFETPAGRSLSIPTIFQVWTRVNADRIKPRLRASCASYVRIYSLSDGGAPASTRNKSMLRSCDVYLPSTCFAGMRACASFEELPYRRGYGVVILRSRPQIKRLLMAHDWMAAAFRSTNSALNLRRSIIEDVIVKGGFVD